MQVKKQQLELDMEKVTGSKWGMEYVKDVTWVSCVTGRFFTSDPAGKL